MGTTIPIGHLTHFAMVPNDRSSPCSVMYGSAAAFSAFFGVLHRNLFSAPSMVEDSKHRSGSNYFDTGGVCAWLSWAARPVSD